MEQHLELILRQHGVSYSLHEKQLDAISSVVSGKNTLCVFPTGFGKSDVYGWVPILVDEVSFTSCLVCFVMPRICGVGDY